MSTSLTNPSELLRLAKADIEAIEDDQTRLVFLAIRAGSRLLAAKALVNHGDYIPFIEQNGIPRSTAHNYARIAKEAQDHAKLTPSQIQALATQDAVSRAVHNRLAKWIDGRTLTEIQLDLGLRKRRQLKPATPDQGGGEDPPPGEPTQMEFARRFWFGPNGLREQLHLGAVDRSYAHLPREDQQVLLDELVTITNDLRTLIKARH